MASPEHKWLTQILAQQAMRAASKMNRKHRHSPIRPWTKKSSNALWYGKYLAERQQNRQ